MDGQCGLWTGLSRFALTFGLGSLDFGLWEWVDRSWCDNRLASPAVRTALNYVRAMTLFERQWSSRPTACYARQLQEGFETARSLRHQRRFVVDGRRTHVPQETHQVHRDLAPLTGPIAVSTFCAAVDCLAPRRVWVKVSIGVFFFAPCKYPYYDRMSTTKVYELSQSQAALRSLELGEPSRHVLEGASRAKQTRLPVPPEDPYSNGRNGFTSGVPKGSIVRSKVH